MDATLTLLNLGGAVALLLWGVHMVQSGVQRAFGAELWCKPRDYPGLTARLACMGADYRVVRSAIEARYPFYKSTAAERTALFEARDLSQDMRSPPARALCLTGSGAEAPSPA